MGGKTASQCRIASGKTLNLFSIDTTLGWKISRQVGIDVAIQKLALRQWREVFYEDGALAGVQPLKPEERKTLSEVLLSRLIAVTITNPELRRNAGLHGKSRTLGKSEWERERYLRRAEENHRADPQHHRKILDPEDAIERAVEKVRQWPYPASRLGTDKDGAPIFGDKATRVYPHPPANARATKA